MCTAGLGSATLRAITMAAAAPEHINDGIHILASLCKDSLIAHDLGNQDAVRLLLVGNGFR